MNFIIILSMVSQFSSIHEIDYKNHLNEAILTPVSNIRLNYTALRPSTRVMLKDYYGYLPYWIDTIYYRYFQMELLTHISYFSTEINSADGSLESIPNQSYFFKIRDDGHAQGVNIHMTFIIFGSLSVTNFLNNSVARDNAINNISDFMTNYGIDGVNIDFEFVTSSVRDSFNLFINNLSYALWNHPQGRKDLYIASIAVPEWYPGYDVLYLSEYTDGLYIMGYDFHWSGSSIAGPVSPCIPSVVWGEYCIAKSIGSYKAIGVSPSKIILGLPYYGYDWPTTADTMSSSTTGQGTGVIYYYAFDNANNYGRLWDENSLTPWYRYYTTQWHQCWFDDSVSLDIKFGMVNDSLLQGAGCWALGYDRSYDHLWNTIRRNFWDSTGIEEQKLESAQPIFEISPNPFSRLTTISFSKGHPDRIENSSYGTGSAECIGLKIYDTSGRLVRQLDYTTIRPYDYISWNGTDNNGSRLPSGVYIFQLKFDRHYATKKVILLN